MRVELRRRGEQLICERGGQRVFTAPIGELGGAQVQPTSQSEGRLVLHRIATARWYNLPGSHSMELLAKIKERVLTEAAEVEREQRAPEALEQLRTGRSI